MIRIHVILGNYNLRFLKNVQLDSLPLLDDLLLSVIVLLHDVLRTDGTGRGRGNFRSNLLAISIELLPLDFFVTTHSVTRGRTREKNHRFSRVAIDRFWLEPQDELEI